MADVLTKGQCGTDPQSQTPASAASPSLPSARAESRRLWPWIGHWGHGWCVQSNRVPLQTRSGSSLFFRKHLLGRYTDAVLHSSSKKVKLHSTLQKQSLYEDRNMTRICINSGLKCFIITYVHGGSFSLYYLEVKQKPALSTEISNLPS